MSRPGLTTTNRNAANASTVYPVEFMEILFPDGPLRVSNADRPYTVGGNVYTPRALQLSYPEGYSENDDNSTTRISLTLSALDDEFRARVLSTNYHFVKFNYYMGFCDESFVLLAEPLMLIPGALLSQCVWKLSSGSSTIELSAETRGVLWDQDSTVLTSPSAQASRYPGDSGMDNTAAIATLQVEWGEMYGFPSGSYARAASQAFGLNRR